MSKTKKKILISCIIGVIGVALSVGGCFLYKSMQEKPVETIKSVKKIYTKIFETYTDMEFSKEDLALVSDEELVYTEDLPFLSDGLYVSKLTNEQKNGEDLSEYEKAHDKYLAKLNKEVKNNLSYKIENEEKPTSVSRKQTVTIQSYRMYQYNSDFNAIYSLLIDFTYGKSGVLSTVDSMNDAEKAEFNVISYKAKVKTMEILNSQLKRYRNNDETMSINVYYVNISSTKKAEWRVVNSLEVYNHLSGINYKNENANDSERLNDILDKTYNQYVDVDNYLKLGKVK